MKSVIFRPGSLPAVAAIAFGAVMSLSSVAIADPAPPEPSRAKAEEVHIDRVVVNGGKDIIVGTEDSSFTMSFTATDPSGAFEEPNSAFLEHGTWQGPGGIIGGIAPRAVCERPDATTMTCEYTDPIYIEGHLRNAMAGGPWKAEVIIAGEYHDVDVPTQVKREARLKADVSGGKGKIRATGDLTRADWDSLAWGRYAGQNVQLQFRKSGTNAYITVKSIRTDSAGHLDTSVKAPADGYWRWHFPGDSTTSSVTTQEVHISKG